MVAISLLLAAATFTLDLLQPLGIASEVLYVAVVLVGLWSRERAFVYLLAALASVLTVIGALVSPGTQDTWVVLENRGLAFFAIWIVALAGARRVSDLERSDRDLRESEQRYALVAGLGGMTVWEVVPEEARLIINDEFKNSYHHADNPDSNRIEDWTGRIHVDDREAVRQAMQSVVEGAANSFNLEFRVRSDDGSILWRYAEGFRASAPGEKPVRIIGMSRDITETKQAEAELRESEQRLQGAHRLAKMSHWELDVTTQRFTIYGDVIVDFGRSAEPGEVTADDAFGIVLAEDIERVEAAFARTLINGTPIDETYRVSGGDQGILYMHTLAEAIRDDAGSVVGVRGTSQDVTDQKTADERLRDSAERLLAAQRIAGISNWSLDPATRQLLGSGEYFRQAGLSIEGEETEFSLERGLQTLHPPDIEEIRAAVERCIAQGAAFDVTSRTVSADGQLGFMRTLGEAVRNEAGDIVEIRGATQISTALRAAEELNTRLGRIVEDSLNEVYIFHGETLRFIQVNRGARENLGYSMAELEALTPVDIKPEFNEQQFMDVLVPLQDGSERLMVFETIHQRKDGSRYPVEVHLQLSTADTQPIFAAIIQDITERREAGKRLVQAQKMETVGQLSAGVAHDFNNMLSVVMGNLELSLLKIAGDPELESMLDNALKASQRGAELTRSLLAFSRKQTLFPKPVDINKAAQDVTDLAGRTVAKTVDIAFQPLGDLWAAEVDPALFESALLNLVVNACTAMPNGGTLTISTWNASQLDPAHRDDESWPTADYVCLAVTDTGHGMASDVLERAIDPFFTTKGMAQGSGLGLSMVYGFVEQSGGLFDIVSEPGVGTKVTLSLPRSDGLPTGEDGPTQARRQDEHTRTVLLVEDEPSVMETVAFQLSELGCRVLVAADAEQALRLLGQNTGVDLLFADVVLGPGKNGIDLAIETRQRYPEIKVLCTSGYASEELRARYDGARDLQILGKPFTLDQLRARLDAIFKIDA